jgi:hypothetical protein
MSDVEARCALETKMVDLLEQRGWAVLGATRHGVDLDLEVEHAGQAGKVLFRNGFDAPKGTVAPTPAPRFVRVDLGEPTGEPERWALWDHYSFPMGKHTPSYIATVFHEAMGASWASVSGSTFAPGWNYEGPPSHLPTLLEHAEAVSPARDEAARRDHLFGLGRRNFGPQRRRHGPFLFVALFAMLWVVPVIYCWAQGGAGAAVAAVIYLSGVFAVIMGIVGLVALVRRARQPKGPVEGMEAVAGSLRESGAFELVKLTRAKRRVGLPVVRREEGFLADSTAPLLVSRLAASSSRHPFTLEADLCQVCWPEGISGECRFLPDRWLTVELVGAEAERVNLPAGAREERRTGRVRWSLTGEELDAGRATTLFQSLGAALTGKSGPYR